MDGCVPFFLHSQTHAKSFTLTAKTLVISGTTKTRKCHRVKVKNLKC